MDKESVLEIENIKKRYKLGSIGGGTLKGEIQSKLALMRGKEDPNAVIGTNQPYNKEFWALKGVDFKVKSGERVGIIGHNGAGKSTLLKLISRITAPTEGSISIKGRITSMLEVGTGFHGELTGRENIYLNAAILGMTREEVDAKIDKIIEFSECADFIDTPVKRYSSGMFVKLAFAVASHLDSEIMIMDEVLAVGDVKFQAKCLKKMREIADSENRTILYVSHNMETIKQLCNRVIVLSKGEIIYDGNVSGGISLYYEQCSDVMKLDVGEETRVQLKEYIPDDREYVYTGDCLHTEVLLESKQNLDNLYLRYELKHINDSKLGIYFTKKISVKENEECRLKIDIPINSVPSGEYFFTVVAFLVTEEGLSEDLSRITNSKLFRVSGRDEDYCGIKWVDDWNAYLGYVDANKMEEINV